MDTSQIGLAGEFYVLAQLAHRGYVGTMTLGNAKRVDVVVFNERTGKYWRLEVKTTKESPKSEKIFGVEKFYIWQLSQKHETVSESDLIYCFVALSTFDELPRFFLVPSRTVAKYATWQHRTWLDAVHRRPVKDNTMRKFRVELSDPNKYQENWSILNGT